MPETITTNAETQTAVPAHRVYLRENWDDEWDEQPFLWCDTCAFRAAPEKSSAVLHYDYGWIAQVPGDGEAVLYEPLSIAHWYVKVEIDWFDAEGDYLPILWYGVIYDCDEEAFGSVVSPGAGAAGGSGSGPAPQLSGTQKFAAYGLEILLERETLRGSWSTTSAGAEQALNRPLAFNASGGRGEEQITPNRTPAAGTKGAPLFHWDPTTAAAWTTADIVQYLLAYMSPKDPLGDVQIPFALDPLYNVPPNYDRPRLEQKVETLKELLDKLLDRKRLYSYWVSVSEAEKEGVADQVLIKPFTFSPADFGVPTSFQNPNGSFSTGTAVIPGNLDLISLDFSQAYDIEFASLRADGQHRYDQVVVRGARKCSCWSIGWLDGTLDADWDTGALQDEYEAAASAQADYPPLWAQQRWRNDLFRSSDEFRRVFRWFALPMNWNGLADNGEFTGELNPVFPLDDQFAESDTFFRAGMLFRNELPLFADRDYSGSKIVDGTVTGVGIGSGSGGSPELRKPFALLKIVSPPGEGTGSGSGSGSGSGRYQYVEKLAETAKTDKHALGGASFTCSLRMQTRNLGFELAVHGAPQYMIAKSAFAGQPSDSAPALDYENNLIVTVAADADSFVEAVYPPAPETDPEEEEPEVADLQRTLLIDLSHLEHGNALRLDYVVPGTVVDTQDGLLVRSTGGYVRDDRGRLAGVALAAWQWYKLTRQAFTLKYRQIDGQFEVGSFLLTIGPPDAQVAVNTPITSIEFDLLNGNTTITTGFAELEFGEIV